MTGLKIFAYLHKFENKLITEMYKCVVNCTSILDSDSTEVHDKFLQKNFQFSNISAKMFG